MEYLSKVRTTLEELVKPVENQFDIEIGEIDIKTYDQFRDETYKSNNINPKNKNPINMIKKGLIDIFVNQHTKGNFFEYCETLYVNEDNPISDESDFKKILMHEIGHFAIKKINPEQFTNYEEENIFYLHEGFAEFLSLDFLSKLYHDTRLLESIENRKEYLIGRLDKLRYLDSKSGRPQNFEAPYCFGYNFIQSINQKDGKDGIIETIMNPPSIDEIKYPI
jgi:hypothetical protein|tara:strand:- start:41 stop:706 length:666 start_codon:yes stop_codon:yes gene_type:complete